MKNKTPEAVMLAVLLLACAGIFLCASYLPAPYSYIASAAVTILGAAVCVAANMRMKACVKKQADIGYKYAADAFGSRVIKLNINTDKAYEVDAKTPYMGTSFIFSKRIAEITEKMDLRQAEEVRRSLSLENIALVIKNKESKSFIFKGSVFDDEIRWYKCDIRACAEGENAALIIFKDVEEEKQKQDEIRRRAETDSLTGLLNRGAFEEQAAVILKEKCSENSRYVYILIDIDNFKEINDTQGHPGGDRILEKTAQNMKTLCDEYSALAGRLGGDEFALILPAPTRREDLNKLCGSLLAAFNAAGNEKHAVSASVGICIAPKDGTELQQLYSRADVAMYQAKINGKNQCCFFNTLNLHKDAKALMARLRERSDYTLMPNGEFEENNYLEYVFSTLYKANNSMDAMTDILEFTVRYFACECGYAVSPTPDGKCFSVDYEWCKSGYNSSARLIASAKCSNEAKAKLYGLLRKNGIYSSQTFTSLPEEMRLAFEKTGVTGVVMLPLWDSIERLSGIIVLEVKDIARGLPTKEEVRALRLAGRVVSSFLIQSYSQQLLNENFAATKSVIDSVPTGIYVVERNNYRLMFFNKEAELTAENTPRTGQCCYSAFYGLDSPCKNCPIGKIPAGEKSVITQFSSDDNKQHMQMAVNETRWKAGRPAYIVTAFNQLQTAEEKEQQRRDRRYRMALKDVYQCVCEIELYSGIYQVFAHSEHTAFALPPKGLFEEEFKAVCRSCVDKQDCDVLCEKFSLKQLAALQSGEINNISCDFRVSVPGEERKIWCNASAAPSHGEDGSPDSVILFIREIEQQKRAEHLENTNELLKKELEYKDELAKNEKRYRTIVEQTGTMVFEWASTDKQQLVTPEIYKTLEIDEKLKNGVVESMLGLLGSYPVLYGDDEQIYEQFISGLNAEEFYKNRRSEIQVRLKTRGKGYRWYKIAVTLTDDDSSAEKHYIGTLLDVDEQIKAFNTLKYRAEFDPLTGIYSYDKFCISAQDLMHRNYRSKYAVISFDIDKFKLINDLYGIDTGDEALRHIGNVLLHNLPRHSRCARMHSDVFCMAVPYISRQDIITLVRRLATKFSQFKAGIQLSAFFGIYLVEDINTPVSLMLDRAHLAKHSVKGSVVKRYMFYEDDLRVALLEEQNIEHDMYAALANHEFVVYLQPKYNLDKNAVCGAEALVRWQHPKRGLLLPGQFIPILERNGFIMRVDEYVWEESCRIMRSWIDKGLDVLPISVNVSRMHIYSANFVNTMQSLIKKYDLKPEMLHLELTETLFFENHDRMLQIMTELRKAGFVLEMDDFGSGYSSLNILRKVPVNAIKIDKGFLDETISSDRGQVVVSHTVAMAKELNLTVIAEGVETKEQMDYLRIIECDDIQGFYIAKPIPQRQFEDIFLQRGSA